MAHTHWQRHFLLGREEVLPALYEWGLHFWWVKKVEGAQLALAMHAWPWKVPSGVHRRVWMDNSIANLRESV
jgi:hypothetical protein